MKKREFNALLKKITTNKMVDINKIPNLSHEERCKFVVELVRMRAPILFELIPDQLDPPFDRQWLYSCGYFSIKKNANYRFLCTDEQAIHLKLT